MKVLCFIYVVFWIVVSSSSIGNPTSCSYFDWTIVPIIFAFTAIPMLIGYLAGIK